MYSCIPLGSEKGDSLRTFWVYANFNQVFTMNHFFCYRYYDFWSRKLSKEGFPNYVFHNVKTRKDFAIQKKTSK